LDGVGELNVKIPGFRADTDANTIYIVDGVLRVVVTNIKDMFPKAPMRMDAQEALAKSDENRDVEKRIRGQLVELNPIDKKKAAEEFVNREGKAAHEEVDESYPKT
jgi:hypothetical protein